MRSDLLSLDVKGSSALMVRGVCGVCRPLASVVARSSLFHGKVRLVEGVANSLVLVAFLGVSTAVMTWSSSSLNASSAAAKP